MKELILRLTHYIGIKKRFSIFLINKVFKGVNPRFFSIKAKLLRTYGCQVGVGTKIVGPILINKPIEIGDHCWIGRNFQVHGNGTFRMGNKCDIAPDVTILTGSHEIGSHDRRASGSGIPLTVLIGDGCWIGARATILGDAEIHDGVVVAACACVVGNVEKDVLVAGVPARKIRDLE